MRPITAQDRHMRGLIHELQLVSSIPAVNLESSRSSDPPGGNRPPGDYGYLHYARWYGPPFHEPTHRFPGCRDDIERQACIEAATHELQHLRKTTRREDLEAPETTREQLLHETEGWSPQAVSTSHWRISVSILRRMRIAAGRDAETGRPVVLEEDPGTDLASRARELAAQGFSQRQIMLLLGLKHRNQVVRLLQKVA